MTKVTQAATGLGINTNNLRRLIKEYEQEQTDEHLSPDEREELRLLRKRKKVKYGFI